MTLSLDDFDYELPRDLIAQHPAKTRGAGRLLRLADNSIADHQFTEFPRFLREGDVLVLNDTRVIRARLLGTKESGGKVEVMVERVLGRHEVLAQVRASHAPQTGTRLRLAGSVEAQIIERCGDFYALRFIDVQDVFETLERHGVIPLPPYIEHSPDYADEQRYQTVYAREPGAVAAPTAGLHFDTRTLDALTNQGVELAWLTLHVGAGTFQPVRVRDIACHRMHAERYSIPEATAAAIAAARARGNDVVAVGTTSLRALESAAQEHGGIVAGAGETSLFITPGYSFRVAGRLLTNFHLPKSTLLMLVCAFGGMDAVRGAYRHAIAQRYRFFSYGDAMLIDRKRT